MFVGVLSSLPLHSPLGLDPTLGLEVIANPINLCLWRPILDPRKQYLVSCVEPEPSWRLGWLCSGGISIAEWD